MAGVGLTLEIDAALAADLRAAAADRGVTVEALALERLTAPVMTPAAREGAEGHARLAEYDRSGGAYDAEGVMQGFRDRMVERLRVKHG